MAGIYEEECIRCGPGEEPLTSTRCHSCRVPQLYKALEGKLKGKISVFLYFVFILLLLISWHDACQLLGCGKG